jgi:hypothetical protein
MATATAVKTARDHCLAPSRTIDGPLGGRIVAEVLLGIIENDPESYRAAEADWTPSLPARNEGVALTDLLVPVE